MNLLQRQGPVHRRLRPVLLAVGAIWASHRAATALAARPFRDVLAGYQDSELLAAGGELPLELVVIHEGALGQALVTAALWLLAARAPAFFASFWLESGAYALATAKDGQRSDTPRLHVAWALLLALAASLLEAGVLLALAWGLVRWARWLRHSSATDWLLYVGWAALGSALVWALCEVWLDLFRQAIVGARQRPRLAAGWASRTWLGHLGPLLSLRSALLLAQAGITMAGVLLLPAITRGNVDQRFWAVLAIDLGLVGSLCLRAAWLTWASAHLGARKPADLRPASSEDAAPSAEPAAPADPSPSPDA